MSKIGQEAQLFIALREFKPFLGIKFSFRIKEELSLLWNVQSYFWRKNTEVKSVKTIHLRMFILYLLYLKDRVSCWL